MFGRRTLVAIACTLSAHAATGHAQAARDSAGVRIVSYPRSAEPRTTWRLSERPLVEIGVSDDPSAEFAAVRGVVRLDDGRQGQRHRSPPPRHNGGAYSRATGRGSPN